MDECNIGPLSKKGRSDLHIRRIQMHISPYEALSGSIYFQVTVYLQIWPNWTLSSWLARTDMTILEGICWLMEKQIMCGKLPIVYHRNCRSTYTSTEYIERSKTKPYQQGQSKPVIVMVNVSPDLQIPTKSVFPSYFIMYLCIRIWFIDVRTETKIILKFEIQQSYFEIIRKRLMQQLLQFLIINLIFSMITTWSDNMPN